MKYKIYKTDETIECDNYEEAVAMAIVLCSNKDQDIRLTVIDEDGKEQPILRTSKILGRETVYVAKVKQNHIICSECQGNGMVEINQFRQTAECENCNGRGYSIQQTDMLEVEGPYIVADKNKKLLKRTDRKISISKYEAEKLTKDEKDWMVLWHKLKMVFESFFEIYVFLSHLEAERFVNNHNQIKVAEQKSLEDVRKGMEEREEQEELPF